MAKLMLSLQLRAYHFPGYFSHSLYLKKISLAGKISGNYNLYFRVIITFNIVDFFRIAAVKYF